MCNTSNTIIQVIRVILVIQVMHSMQVMKVIQAVHKLQVMRAIPVMKVMKVREGLKKWLFFMTFAIKRGRGSGAPLSFFFQILFFKPCRIVHGLQKHVFHIV